MNTISNQNVIQNPIKVTGSRLHNQVPNTTATNTQNNFADVLNRTIDNAPLQFSKHATARLDAREINLSGEQLERVEEGVRKARSKGIKDSLVLVDNIALLVNVGSKVVVTAMNKDNDHVFTQIDGAVIV